MRVRITFRRGSGGTAEPYLFSDVFVRRQPTWPSLLASAAAHGLVLALIPTLVKALSGIGYAPAEWPTYAVETIRLELPGPIYLPLARPRPEAPSKAAKPAAVRRPHQVQPAAGAGLRAQSPIPKQLELPVTQHISDQAPVILQPNPVTLATPSVPVLPPIAFWTRDIQPPPRRRAVIPGRVQKPSVSPNLDAPPVLSLSTPQPVASDIAVALAEARTVPKLPLPNSSTNPVRMRGQGGAEIASFDVRESDPVNLIYLMARNPETRQAEIPRGLQNTPHSDADAGTQMQPGRASGDREGSARSLATAHERTTPGAGDAARGPELASASAAAAAAAAASAAAATAAAARTPITAASPGASRAAADSASRGASQPNGVAPGNSLVAGVKPADHAVVPTGARPPDPVPDSSVAVIRMTHPSNGNFDVVILQSVTRDDLPDVGGTLLGNPVYTVYLSVGDSREWLLEYCIPASANSRASTYQVNIDDPGVVSAPYPLSTAIPRSVFELPHPQHIVLHGLLSAAGILRAVKAPNMENALVREVLPLLGQWQFRPALRGKVPVEVEILLIIPPRA